MYNLLLVTNKLWKVGSEKAPLSTDVYLFLFKH